MLNDLEKCCIAAKSMRYTEDEALVYLRAQGHDIQKSTYYKILGHISAETRTRAYEIAKSFLEDHINTVDELENIKKEMYRNAVKETDPLKNTIILSIENVLSIT